MTENARLTIRETAALSEACFLEAAEYVQARSLYRERPGGSRWNFDR